MTTPPRKRAPKPPAVKSAPPAPLGLVEVVAAGDRRESLIALRDELARRLVLADKDIAAIARQLTNILQAIAELPAPAERSTLDEIAAKRAARRTAAS